MQKQLAILDLMHDYSKKRALIRNDHGGKAIMSAFIIDNSNYVLCDWI
jgi:hypothetical protein